MPMAAGTDCSHPFIRLEGSYNKSSVSHAKDEFEEESDEWKQPSVKPPLHFSVEQHSISSETLLVSADLDFGVDIKEIECASEGKPSFLPVFRSGSCAEMGPKQYMEDEHIRIDNLAEYLGESASFGSPGAFYGVKRSAKRWKMAIFRRRIYKPKLEGKIGLGRAMDARPACVQPVSNVPKQQK